MINIKENLFLLSSLDAAGPVSDARDAAENLLSSYMEIKRGLGLNTVGFLKGESDYTLLLDAHIDQVAFTVTGVDENGFLTVSNAGGIDMRSLPTKRALVYGKEKINAVFTGTPPHLAKESEALSDLNDIRLDTLTFENDKISVGDFVFFDSKPSELLGTRVAGKSFDNRAGVACLIEIAEKLKGKKLPFNVAFVLSDGEELGLRGIRSEAFKINPDEAIVIDVSFGNGIGISAEESGELGKGAMIGVGPFLSKEITSKLIAVSKENNISYQLEPLSSSTGTNADMISVTKNGVKTGTVSIPLRNMHTENEIIDLSDIENAASLISNYILAGGVKNA